MVDSSAQRVKAAHDRLGAAQRGAFWRDLVRVSAGRRGPREMLRRLTVVGRELTVPRLPLHGESLPPAQQIPHCAAPHPYAAWADVCRDGVVPLAPLPPGRDEATPLHVAVIIPPFGFGSGGIEVVFRVIGELETQGHTVTLWMDDPAGEAADAPTSVLLRRVDEDHGLALRAPLHRGLDHWYGADLALATGWQTVWPVLRLPGVHARAYLVNDDEAAFYPRSIETELAARTYGLGLYCIAGRQWMYDLIHERDGARGGWFDYATGPEYWERPVQRRDDTIVLYARSATPRRAVALGVLALEELIVRRGRRVRVRMYGDLGPLPNVRYDFEFLGLVRPERLAWTYSEATVGVALSMTNASLVPQDMMACGLPVVDLAGGSSEVSYGDVAGIAHAEFDPVAMANVIERLLDDRSEREHRRAAGLALAAEWSWRRSGKQVEEHLRAALRERRLGSVA